MILACRSEARTRPVLEQIVADSGNEAVEFLALDLADLGSVRDAAATLVEADEPLHVLVANAGLAGQRGRTAQGFELAFGVNHLGHFLLVTELAELLASSATDEPSRVVVVASDSHFQAKGIPWEAVREPTRSRTGLREYAVSKLCNVLFAQELRRREDPRSVWVGVLHPGVIASDVWRSVPWPIRPIMTRFMRSTEDGAATSIMCATSTDVLSSDVEYWSEGRPKDPNPVATPELADQLWSRSDAWVADFRA